MTLVFEKKIIKKTDLKHRFAVPMKSLPTFKIMSGHQYVDFKAKDVKDDIIRVFRLYTRKNGHPKPVLTTGWRDYVNHKEIKLGDKITIRRNEDGTFSIQAERNQIKLFGSPIWSNFLLAKLKLSDGNLQHKKKINKTDLTHRFAVPVKSLPAFKIMSGHQYVDFKAKDVKDDIIWVFRLYTRKNGHPKPVLTTGWRDYVNHKEIKLGDKITIRLNEDGTFCIQAERKQIKLFGGPIWFNLCAK
ncbi:hypothetical protein ACFE04_022469 [Oxalis oulophora]